MAKRIKVLILLIAIMMPLTLLAYAPKPGNLIKLRSNPAIYVVGNDLKKHLFPTESTYWSWYAGRWSSQRITIISQSDFDKIETGKNVTLKPGYRYIKFDNSPRVYGYNIKLELCPWPNYYAPRDTIVIPSAFESDYTINPFCQPALKEDLPKISILDLFKVETPPADTGGTGTDPGTGTGTGSGSGSGDTGDTNTSTPTSTPPSAYNPPPTVNQASYFIENVSGKTSDQAGKAIFAASTAALPSKCSSYIDPNTGMKVTRITNVNDYPTLGSLIDGNPSKGFTNGYSRFANANINGQYMLAYGTNAHVVLYRVSDCAFLGPLEYTTNPTSDFKAIITESRNPRWDMSGAQGTQTIIYYTRGSGLYKQDVLIGRSSESLVYNFAGFQGGEGITIHPIDHSDQSPQYRAIYLNATNWPTPRWVVYDLKNNILLPGAVTSIDEGDVSPMGAWVYSDKKYYRISDLAQGKITPAAYTPTTSHGHDGWSFDKNGQEVHVFQDNRNDWFSAYNPGTNVRTNIVNMSETGWKVNQHLGRISSATNKGWMFMATYACDSSSWAGNQLLMFEIKSFADYPRIWRIGHTNNSPFATCDSSKDYFAEAFANLDFNGQYANWGSNWHRNDNLEVYRMELPQNWQGYLNDAPAVSFTNVNNGDTLWATKEITATASASSGVSRVELFADNILQATDSVYPYSLNLDTTKFSDGNHTLRLDVYSNNSSQGTTALDVKIDNLAYSGLTKVKFQYGQPISALGISNYTGTKDTAMTSNTGNASYYERGSATIFDYRATTRVGLYWFDLSAIPQNSTITDARLILYSPGTNNSERGGVVPVYLVKSLAPNDNVSWVEGLGISSYDQYKGTCWLKKGSVAGVKPTYTWSTNPGRYSLSANGFDSTGDLFSAYRTPKAGDMNFVKVAGEQKSTNIASAVQYIFDNNYKYEGFAVDKFGIADTVVRKDGIATKEYSDANMRPALEITYRPN